MTISPFGWVDDITDLDAANLEAANAHAGAYVDEQIETAGGVQVAGDIGGTSSSPVVETVQDGQTPVTVASFLGSSQLIRPTGGSNDGTNINSVLSSSANTSFYLNGNYKIDEPILPQSGQTLVLADCSLKLNNGVNLPIIANQSYASSTTPAASNIHVRGIGRAILDYNGSNQTEQNTALYNSCCLTLTNVSNFSIENVQCQNAQYLYIKLDACSNGWVRDIHGVVGATDKGFLHCDVGCSNIVVDGITAKGTFTDAVFSMLSTTLTSPQLNTPYVQTLSGAARNISQISFNNIVLSSSTGLFNPWVDSNATISDIDISNVHNTYTGATLGEEIQLGPAGYDSVSLSANSGSINGIRVKGYTFGGTGHTFMTLDTSASNIQVSNIRANGPVLCLLGNDTFLQPSIQAGYYPQGSQIKFSDVILPQLSGTGAALMKIFAGWNLTDIEFSNILIGTTGAPILANASDVTGLRLQDVHVNLLASNPFTSTGNEIGVVRNFTYDSKTTAVTAILPGTTNWRIEQPFPALSPADTTPAAVQGSQINCNPGKDPTGGAATTGGRYTADGSSWNLTNSFNSVFHPGQMFYPLLFHYDAAKILGLSNGGSVVRWPDGANNNAMVQTTSANQPTWNSSDSHLNSHPSVSFNGSSQWIQNSLLTPFSAAQPFSFFIVYYWTTLTSGKYCFDAATTASGSDGPTYYNKTGSAAGFTLGTASAQSPTGLVINTPYVACCTGISQTEHVGENKAAFASLTSISSAGTRTITGFTLAASYNGAANFGAVTVAEVFAYGSLISQPDYATIMAALAAKYGVTLA